MLSVCWRQLMCHVKKKKRKKKQAQTINAYHYKDIIGVQSDVKSQEKNIKTLIQPDVVMYK